MRIQVILVAVSFLNIVACNCTLAGPVTGEETARQVQVIEQLKKAVATQNSDAVKFTHISQAMKDEPDPDVRRRVLAIAAQIPGGDLEAFLKALMTSETDAGIRIQAVTLLGQKGSEKCLATLADVAANDRTTMMRMGDIATETNARRAATFAIAELATRFPKLTDDAVKKLRNLPAGKANEPPGDERIQAIYQITHDEALLKPFYDRLKSKDAKERENGVVAFRFLKLKQAPAQLVAAMKDSEPDVRSWCALVLGEIGDPKTGPPLMTAAADTKEENSVRCNAIQSLGQMKFAGAAELMEKLLNDTNPSVPANAAIAMYRITGKKVEQFPKGDSAD